MKTAVVILNWNGKKMLEEFLPNVVNYSSSTAQVIIIDNASSDDSNQFIESKFPDIEIVKLKENLGYAGGYNEGLKHIKGRFEYYVLLNSDVEVTQNWITPIVDFMNGNPDVAACQPKIKDFANKNFFEHAGAAGGYIDKYGFPFCRGRIFQSLEEDKGQFEENAEVFWASGSCFFVRSEIFHELNGFDADFFAHMEEIDLCWRLKSKGHKIVYFANTSIYHVGGGSLPKSNPRKTFLNFRNVLLMLLKNLPSNTLYITIFQKLVFDGIAGIKFLFEGDVKDFFAVIKAHMSFYALFFKFKEKRKLLEQKRVPNIYNKSVVIQHFLKGRNEYGLLDKDTSNQ